MPSAPSPSESDFIFSYFHISLFLGFFPYILFCWISTIITQKSDSNEIAKVKEKKNTYIVFVIWKREKKNELDKHPIYLLKLIITNTIIDHLNTINTILSMV